MASRMLPFMTARWSPVLRCSLVSQVLAADASWDIAAVPLRITFLILKIMIQQGLLDP